MGAKRIFGCQAFTGRQKSMSGTQPVERRERDFTIGDGTSGSPKRSDPANRDSGRFFVSQLNHLQRWFTNFASYHV